MTTATHKPMKFKILGNAQSVFGEVTKNESDEVAQLICEPGYHLEILQVSGSVVAVKIRDCNGGLPDEQ